MVQNGIIKAASKHSKHSRLNHFAGDGHIGGFPHSLLTGAKLICGQYASLQARNQFNLRKVRQKAKWEVWCNLNYKYFLIFIFRLEII